MTDKIYECPRCSYMDLKENMEEQMKDKRVIFRSEEDFDNVFDSCGIDKSRGDHINNFTREFIKERLKQAGYIRKNPVEEYEERLKRYQEEKVQFTPFELLAIEAVKYLKEQQSK